jgi:hypothetical protein
MKLRFRKSADFEFTKAVTRIKSLQNRVEEAQAALEIAANIFEPGNTLPAPLYGRFEMKTTDDLIRYFRSMESNLQTVISLSILILDASKSK